MTPYRLTITFDGRDSWEEQDRSYVDGQMPHSTDMSWSFTTGWTLTLLTTDPRGCVDWLLEGEFDGFQVAFDMAG